jgi:polyisoprenoid-binding protein YceI
MYTKRDQPAAAPQLGRYEIDTDSSTLTFATRHLFGLAPVRGSFAIRTGTIDIAWPLADSVVYVEIDAASFRTGNRQRDDKVRSARLLDAGRHPVITFTSEHIETSALTGALTVCGVTRPVSLQVEQLAISPRSFTARARTRVDRAEFGVTALRGLAGRYLDICAEVRGIAHV